MAALQVREKAPDPRLDRLLLFFRAHYLEGDPHLLCIDSPFKEDKGQDTANHFKEKDVTAQGGKLLTHHIWVV